MVNVIGTTTLTYDVIITISSKISASLIFSGIDQHRCTHTFGDGESGGPVFVQDVKANISVWADVHVVDWSFKLNLQKEGERFRGKNGL